MPLLSALYSQGRAQELGTILPDVKPQLDYRAHLQERENTFSVSSVQRTHPTAIEQHPVLE